MIFNKEKGGTNMMNNSFQKQPQPKERDEKCKIRIRKTKTGKEISFAGKCSKDQLRLAGQNVDDSEFVD